MLALKKIGAVTGFPHTMVAPDTRTQGMGVLDTDRTRLPVRTNVACATASPPTSPAVLGAGERENGE